MWWEVSELHSFLWPWSPPTVWIYNILVIYLSPDSRLDGSHFLSTAKNAAMDIHIQVFTWTCVFSSRGCFSRAGTAGLCVTLFCCLSSCHTVSRIPTTAHEDSSSSTFSPIRPTVWLFDSSPMRGYEVLFHFGFDLRFPDD